ncbi:BamA/TamA family outer membrane protein [Ferrimonas marina]|uniref:Haemolysin activator HlyB C-terminal domain-containing protein n=1 Tax=Ferrimonas marina TaxID=299255 RepID=A0A1M5VIB0_9GAMM|nr:hypothetical protein [Ferrimonas marina]SHH74961.1 hypothetical protein SAMN02745129_2794 [Ferrimonas marina]
MGLFLLPLPLSADDDVAALDAQCGADPQYQIIRHNVFDSSAPGFTWLHRLANQLHFTTREVTVQNAVAGFTPCEEEVDDLYELERHLRTQSYLRDAKVRRKGNSNEILVETYDTWSLLPTVDFSRRGGENAAAVGLKDSNFLGLGINTEVAYFSDYLRDGYLLDIHSPLYLNQNLSAGLTLADTSDGHKASFSLQRPFFSLDSRHGFGLAFNDEARLDSIRQREEEVNQFEHRLNQFSVWYGQTWFNQQQQALRWQVGYSRDRHEFRPDQENPEETTLLPEDRERSYPWVQLLWQQDRYEKHTNLFLINAVEDVNFGWDLALKLGWDFAQNEGWVAQMYASRGWSLTDRLIWLSQFWGEGEQLEDNEHQHRLQWRNELFFRVTEPVRLYSKLDWRHSQNDYLDQPNTLGGTNGLRGYPLQYQHGDNIWLGSLEARYYPGLNLWQLFDAGAALFYDIGEAQGGSPYPDNPEGTLQSYGVGLRFFASRAGSNNIVHVDFARPVSDDPNVDRWEWRIEVKRHF